MNAAANPKASPTPLPDLQEAIRQRAEEIYFRSGRIPGRDLDNWAQAEQEILRESAPQPSRKPAIVVRVSGTEYVGEYNPHRPLTVMFPESSIPAEVCPRPLPRRQDVHQTP